MCYSRVLCNRYEVRGKCLATSKRSHVEFATDRQNGEAVVVKFSEDASTFDHEREFLSGHGSEESICRMKDSFDVQDAGKTLHCLVLEAGDEDLSMYWDRKKRSLSPIESAWIGRSIAIALQSMHDQGWVHCDMKPQNVVRFFDGQWKLIDFEMAVKEGETTRGLTIGYMPPENARAHPAGIPAEKSQDVWSFGAILYEMMTGKNFLEHLRTPESILAWLRTTEEMSLPSSLPDFQRDLLSLVLQKDPSRRISIDEILAHPALQLKKPSSRLYSRRPTIQEMAHRAAATESPEELTGAVDAEESQVPSEDQDQDQDQPSADLQKAVAKIESLEREKQSLQERVNALSKDKSRMVEDRQAAETKIDWAQQEAKNAKDELKRLQESLNRLSVMKEALERDKLALRQENCQLKVARDCLKKLELEHTKAKETLSSVFRDYEAVVAAKTQLEMERMAREREVESLRDQCARLADMLLVSTWSAEAAYYSQPSYQQQQMNVHLQQQQHQYHSPQPTPEQFTTMKPRSRSSDDFNAGNAPPTPSVRRQKASCRSGFAGLTGLSGLSELSPGFPAEGAIAESLIAKFIHDASRRGQGTSLGSAVASAGYDFKKSGSGSQLHEVSSVA